MMLTHPVDVVRRVAAAAGALLADGVDAPVAVATVVAALPPGCGP